MWKWRSVLFHLCLLAILRFGEPYTIFRSSVPSNEIALKPRMTGEVLATARHRDDYRKIREHFIREETQRGVGADTALNEQEQQLNEILMKAKRDDLASGIGNPFEFLPSRHIFEVMDQVHASKIFKIMHKMPKGAILHAHDTAICNLDFIVQLTHWPYLWVRMDSNGLPLFRFSRVQPKGTKHEVWELVADVRTRDAEFDARLRKQITLFTDNPIVENRDVNSIWGKFQHIFSILDGIISFRDAWEAYYKQALVEVTADNVQYLELRSVLPKLYDLDGRDYDEVDVVQIYHDVTEAYKLENPNFIGAKIIYAPMRFTSEDGFIRYIEMAKKLHNKFPDFMMGFDLVGQEDLGKALFDFADQILSLPPSIKLYFHAGETNWSGQTDDNMVDAILMGTQRIGHGFALIKHPSVLQYIKENNIAIEVNPISNQVLRLVADLRNHPASVLFTDGYPVVVSSDDPSFWETKPLSHDFYMAFLGIANSRQDLRFIKRLVMNSINYSGMHEGEKKVAFEKWTKAWDKFVQEAVIEFA